MVRINGKAKELVCFIRDEYLPNEILTIDIHKEKM